MEYKVILEQSPDPVSGDDMTLELEELRTNLEKKISRIFKEIQSGTKTRLTYEDYKAALIGGINITTVKTDKGIYITLSQAVMISTETCAILKLLEKASYKDNACFEF